MTVTAQEFSIHDEHRVALSITGAESLRLATGGRFQPSGLIIVYGRLHSSPQLAPNQWALISVTAHGKKLKAGGDLLATDASCIWWPPDEKPEWVTVYVDKYHPAN